MLKIRLMRIGTKKKPFYRVVVVDERSKRTGAYIELLGTYNPLTEPKDIQLKKDRIDHWIKQGAQPSTGYLRIIGKAPQRPPRKPKKEAKQATGDSGQVKSEEPVAEETAKPSESETTEQTETQEATAEPESSSTQTEPVVNNSAEEPKSEMNETSESAQNQEGEKTDEGSA